MKILVVIDMQNDFIDGALGSPEAQAIVPAVAEKIKSCAGEDTLVLFTKDTHGENYMETTEGKYLPVPHCIRGTDGWKINKEISRAGKTTGVAMYNSETIINSRILKGTFASNDLAALIKYYQDMAECAELVGVCTDICVVSNALLIKTMCPDLKVIVDASCCAATTPEKHEAALKTMESCQVEIINWDKE